jgi:hypothetical protein
VCATSRSCSSCSASRSTDPLRVRRSRSTSDDLLEDGRAIHISRPAQPVGWCPVPEVRRHLVLNELRGRDTSRVLKKWGTP